MTKAFVCRRAVVAAFVVLSAVAVSAQEPGASTAPQGGDAERQLRSVHRQMFEASQRGDKERVAQFLADDLTWISAQGPKVMSKSEMLAGLPTPAREVEIEKVNVLGNAAIVTGMAHLKDGTDGRFMQQWVKQNNSWRLMSHHGTRVMTDEEVRAGSAGTAGTSGTGEPAARPAGRSGPPPFRSADERAVWQLQTKMHEAFLKGDADTYAKLTADEYVRVLPTGVTDKSQFLEQVRRNAGKTGGRIEYDDARVTVSGDTARIIVTTWGTMPGGEAIPPSRVTRVFQKKDGQWQQVAAAFAPVGDMK